MHRRIVPWIMLVLLYPWSAGLAQPIPDNLVREAAKEGRVVWYTQPGFGEALAKPLAEFRRTYPGVKVELVEAGGPELMERVRAERRAGRQVGDIISLGDTAAFELAREGGLEPWTAEWVPNAGRIKASYRPFIDKDRLYLPTSLFAYGINVNTDALPKSEWPRKWTDLLLDKYKGKLVFHDPSRPGGGLGLLLVGLRPLGENFFRKLMDQQPRVFARVQEVDGAVVRGERAISVPGRSRVRMDYGDAPVEWIVPEDGAFFVSYTTGVIKNAPRPAAAHLLLNFILGPSAQAAFAELGDVPVIEEVASPVPLDTLKLLGTGGATADDLDRIKERMALGREIIKPR